jgi:hypothetical protein
MAAVRDPETQSGKVQSRENETEREISTLFTLMQPNGACQ